jgi:predicted metal-dependent peptidase
MPEKLPEKLENALKLLWKKSRFTSYFYQSCEFINSEEVPTVALHESGMRPAFYYNKSFINTLTVKNINALLVHELLHVIFRHDHRSFSNMNPYLQNLAQDMVVNSYIKDNISSFFSKSGYNESILELPESLPLVPDYFYRETGIKDPGWEDVYKWLKNRDKTKLSEFTEEVSKLFKDLMPDTSKEKKKEKDPGIPLFKTETKSKNNDSTGLVFTDSNGKPVPTGSHIFSETSVSKRLETHSKKMTAFASSDPGASEDRIFNLITSIMGSPDKTDSSKWEKKIKSIVDASAHSSEIEFSYKRFNRRYFAQEIYAAGKIMKDKQRVITAVDVSASVTSNPGELEKAFGAVESLLGRYRVELLCLDESLFIPGTENGIITKTRDLNKKFFYKKGDWKKIKTGSGGTTLFAPLFNEYLKNRNETVIVITDGYIHDINRLKPYKNTLWLISPGGKQDFKPPFGKYSFIDTKEV